MSPTPPLEALRRRWRPALLTFVGAMAVILAGVDLAPRRYTAVTTLRLVPSTTASETYRLDLADRLMNTLATLVTTRPIESELKARLHTATVPKVRVEMPANTELMRIITRGSAPAVAATAANELASILVERSRTYQGTGTPSPLELTVVEPAVPPTAPSWPDETLLFPVGLLIALLAAAAVGLLFERLDPTVRSAAHLAALTHAPVLAQVPRLASGRRRKPGGGAAPFREAFRYLALRLRERIPASSGQLVLVTGCRPGDGASTVAANLATTAANQGARALVVDCNLRRPALHELFGVPNKTGLSTVLAGRAEPPDAICASRVRGVSVLPSGPSGPQEATLVDATAMQELLGTLSAHFDLVILDTASMAEGADAVSLAPHVGGAVLVIRRGSVHEDVARANVTSLETTRAGTVGLVLNR